MMTPEQKFARWVRVSIAAFLGIFAWFIVADIWTCYLLRGYSANGRRFDLTWR
jgi:hypothetical protein